MDEGIEWTSAVVHWRLAGPAGAEIDMILAVLLASGLSVECLTPGTEYRVDGGSPERMAALALQVDSLGDGFNLAIEEPAAGMVSITSNVYSARPARRRVHVAGRGEAFGFIARAVDSGLKVTCDGFARWAVAGRTSTLMLWLATHVHRAKLADTLAAWQLTPEMVAAEDADADAPTIKVVLPDRRTTTTEVQRDGDGLISRIVQLEKNAK